MTEDKGEVHFFLGVLALILLLNFFVFLPYLSAILIAAVFAIIFRPLYEQFLKITFGGEGVAALLTILTVLFIVLAPLMFFSIQIFQEASNLYFRLTDTGTTQSLRVLEQYFSKYMPGISLNFGEYLKYALTWLLENLGVVFSSLAQVFLTVFLGMVGMYYLLKDGPRFWDKIVSLIPLEERYAQMIANRLETTVNAVIKGSLMTAVIQGIVAGMGFWIFGVPNPAFWGSFTVLAALVPAVGTSLVVGPAIIYLFLVNQAGAGFGLLIWGMVAVGLIDNFLSPQFMRRGIKIHPFLILLSVLGGITFLGPIGFLAGPLSLSLLFALLDIYPHLVAKH
ncbi:MAG: AI-2E family transporter [Patescibacteria group bacterium]